MRDFSNTEKELLLRINSGYGLNLISLIDPWIDGVNFHIDLINLKLFFEIDTANIPNIENRIIEIQEIIIESIFIVKTFEEKGYFFTYVNANILPSSPFSFGRIPMSGSSQTISYEFPDKRLAELFINYSTREIYRTPELSRFIADNFKSREEVRADRQWNTTKKALRTTTIALVIAILSFIFNIFVNLYNIFCC